ncbi:MAG: ATP-binding protein [Verrucomicrobia bacterium]|nr:ATP-binding protein [Verrucomicrobiota bacterium]
MMTDTLAAQLKYLRLTGLLARWEEYLKAAAQSNLSHARLLTRVIEEEYRLKCDQAREQRLKLAQIPEKLVLDTFPFDRQPKLNQKKILALYDSMAFLKDKQNILWMGGTGVGKTGLATGFLIQAIHQGARGRYVLFADLLHELHRSARPIVLRRVSFVAISNTISFWSTKLGTSKPSPRKSASSSPSCRNATDSARPSSPPTWGLASGPPS